VASHLIYCLSVTNKTTILSPLIGQKTELWWRTFYREDNDERSRRCHVQRRTESVDLDLSPTASPGSWTMSQFTTHWQCTAKTTGGARLLSIQLQGQLTSHLSDSERRSRSTAIVLTTCYWWPGLAVTRCGLCQCSYSMPDPVNAWIGDCLWVGKPSHYVTSHLGQLSLPSHRGR